VVEDRHRVEQRTALEEHAELAPDAEELALGEPRDVLAVHQHAPGVGPAGRRVPPSRPPRMRPALGWRSPPTSRSSVLLPEPLPPRTTEMRRAGNAHVRSWNTGRSPKAMVTWSSWMGAPD